MFNPPLLSFNVERLTRRQQVAFLKFLVWPDRDSNPQPPDRVADGLQPQNKLEILMLYDSFKNLHYESWEYYLVLQFYSNTYYQFSFKILQFKVHIHVGKLVKQKHYQGLLHYFINQCQFESLIYIHSSVFFYLIIAVSRIYSFNYLKERFIIFVIFWPNQMIAQTSSVLCTHRLIQITALVKQFLIPCPKYWCLLFLLLIIDTLSHLLDLVKHFYHKPSKCITKRSLLCWWFITPVTCTDSFWEHTVYVHLNLKVCSPSNILQKFSNI